jgi:hypothetical protein
MAADIHLTFRVDNLAGEQLVSVAAKLAVLATACEATLRHFRSSAWRWFRTHSNVERGAFLAVRDQV